jgi:hypothetical protein
VVAVPDLTKALPLEAVTVAPSPIERLRKVVGFSPLTNVAWDAGVNCATRDSPNWLVEDAFDEFEVFEPPVP